MCDDTGCPISPGYCHCGCGEKTNLVARNCTTPHLVKGTPRRYLLNHGKRVPPTIRFWEKVRKTDTCWFWTGAEDGTGYGVFTVGGRMVKAHRYAYELAHGPFPDEAPVACHDCARHYAPGDRTYRRCVRPDHIVPGTAADNSADMVAAGRQASGDRNASRLYPERRPRGATHHSHLHPEQVRRGYTLGPQPARSGERHYAHALTEAQVRAIRRAAGQETLSALARAYGVSVQAIWAIVHRKTWAHLPED